MTKLIINKGAEVLEYILPQSWAEVSVYQFQELMKQIDNKEATEIQLKIKSISILAKVEESILIKASLKHINEVYEALKKLTNRLPQNTLRNVIEIDSKEYGLITDFDVMTFGEFVDLDSFLQDGYNNLVKILAVLYRPVIKRKKDKYIIEDYNIDSYKDRVKLFKDNLSIDTVYGAMVFFYNIAKNYSMSLLSYLTNQTKAKSIQLQNERKKTVTKR